jgi:hypothetical protein
MHGFSHDEGRTIRVDGTTGTIIGEFLSTKTKLVFYDHLKGTEDIILDIKAGAGTESGHGGGDYGLIRSFVNSIQRNDISDPLTSAEASLESHILAFAAEQSRNEKVMIDLKEYRKQMMRESTTNS